MPLFIGLIVVQLLLIAHVVRTGRSYYWIFILLIAPGIGSLAYVVVELLPEWSGSPRARRAARSMRKVVHPGADLKTRERELKLSGSVDAARKFAAELVEAGRYEEAITHYKEALTGLYEDDPDLMLGLAIAQFRNGDFQATVDTLDRLIEKNPDYRSPDGHLIYAQAVEAIGDDDKAREEYKAVAAYYAGAEAKLRYGWFLERHREMDEALAQFREICATAELAPKHYRKSQQQWIREAKSAIQRIAG